MRRRVLWKAMSWNWAIFILIYSRICGLDSNAHNNQSCIGIECALLSSSQRLKQCALAIRIRIHSTNRSNGKCIDRWQKFHLPENHEWTVKTRVSIVYLQFNFDEMQNDYLIQTPVLFFLPKLSWKKILLLEKNDLIIYFREWI